MSIVTFDALSSDQQELLLRAEAVLPYSYSPYSHFRAGAAVMTSKGIFTGVNMENAVFDLTVHAEPSALSSANTAGTRDVRMIAVIGKGDVHPARDPITPCGICRQILFEASQIAGVDIQVIASNTAKDKILLTTVSALLPHAFGPREVGVDVTRYRTA